VEQIIEQEIHITMKDNNRLKNLPRVKFICSGRNCPKSGRCTAHDNFNAASEKERADNPKAIAEALHISTERCFRPNYPVPRVKKSRVEQLFNRRRLEAQRAAREAQVGVGEGADNSEG